MIPSMHQPVMSVLLVRFTVNNISNKEVAAMIEEAVEVTIAKHYSGENEEVVTQLVITVVSSCSRFLV